MADTLAVCEECESVYAAYRSSDDELYLKGTGKRCFNCGGTELTELTDDDVGPRVASESSGADRQPTKTDGE